VKIPTQITILDQLKQARYLLAGVVDRSPDEVHALDELDELIEHIKDIDAQGYLSEG